MITRRADMRHETKVGMRGGQGEVRHVHLAEPASMRNARLLAEIELPEGASIGSHVHENETEYYIVLEGSGAVDEGSGEIEVGPGDVVTTGHGERHSIRNSGRGSLRFIACIVTHQ